MIRFVKGAVETSPLALRRQSGYNAGIMNREILGA